MRITLITILSAVAIGFTPAHAACPVDVACEPRFWDWIDNLEECEARKKYCLGINKCWELEVWWAEAQQYRESTIIPGYKRCIRNNSQ